MKLREKTSCSSSGGVGFLGIWRFLLEGWLLYCCIDHGVSTALPVQAVTEAESKIVLFMSEIKEDEWYYGTKRKKLGDNNGHTPAGLAKKVGGCYNAQVIKFYLSS